MNRDQIFDLAQAIILYVDGADLIQYGFNPKIIQIAEKHVNFFRKYELEELEA